MTNRASQATIHQPVALARAAGASGGEHDASTVGEYHKGMAIFTVAKGGLMYEASVSGQKFSYDAVN